MYSYGPPHMAVQKQDEQHEHTFSSYMRIWDVVLKTCLGRWTIGRSGERGLGISVLPARYDDDDDVYIYMCVCVYVCVCEFVCACVCVWQRLNQYICIYIMYITICTYAPKLCIYIYIYICTYAPKLCIWTNIYVYVHVITVKFMRMHVWVCL